jgi:hypothetical protein
VETIPLLAGDPLWLFDVTADAQGLLSKLERASRNIEQLATALGTRPGWTGSGMEWHRMPDGATTLVGFTEGTESANFWSEMYPVDRHWVVGAFVAVRCDGAADCGEHVVEQWPTRTTDTPADAVSLLVVATEWLLQRGTAESSTYWRSHDPERHP